MPLYALRHGLRPAGPWWAPAGWGSTSPRPTPPAPAAPTGPAQRWRLRVESSDGTEFHRADHLTKETARRPSQNSLGRRSRCTPGASTILWMKPACVLEPCNPACFVCELRLSLRVWQVTVSEAVGGYLARRGSNLQLAIPAQESETSL